MFVTKLQKVFSAFGISELRTRDYEPANEQIIDNTYLFWRKKPNQVSLLLNFESIA